MGEDTTVPQSLAVAYREMRNHPRRWLVTGSAGFIGSHLLEALLRAGQQVVSVDNFATGYRRNLDEVRRIVGEDAWSRHAFIEGDIVDPALCQRVCAGIDIVLHQAALGSVPRSIEDPLRSHAANATGFLNLLVAARDHRVARFVYAASSSTYGDHPALPKVEDQVGRPLSPYAVTKLVDELYADVFARCYGTFAIGLRYFNVFGPRQDPDGAYAAVIPRWVDAMLRGESVSIHGDGETTRDFCPIDNVVQANLLAAVSAGPEAAGQVFNVAVGGKTSLNELAEALREMIGRRRPEIRVPPAHYAEFRPGDVRHSQADIGKARRMLGYEPVQDLRGGLQAALPWYESQAGGRAERGAQSRAA